MNIIKTKRINDCIIDLVHDKNKGYTIQINRRIFLGNFTKVNRTKALKTFESFDKEQLDFHLVNNKSRLKIGEKKT